MSNSRTAGKVFIKYDILELSMQCKAMGISNVHFIQIPLWGSMSILTTICNIFIGRENVFEGKLK
jgi:hypothetical protein